MSLRELAREIAPDYPGVDDDLSDVEYEWAIRSAYQGTVAANEDLHRLISKLQKRLGMDVHEVIELAKENEE